MDDFDFDDMEERADLLHGHIDELRTALDDLEKRQQDLNVDEDLHLIALVAGKWMVPMWQSATLGDIQQATDQAARLLASSRRSVRGVNHV